MKKTKSTFFATIILILCVITILFPVGVMGVWIFTERFAWPDLFPQVFSMRAVESVLHRKEELAQLFLSSIGISAIVAVLSVGFGIMTARAFVFYEFKGKQVFYFASVLPFLIPATVFAMGIQMLFIKAELSNTVSGVVIAHLICSLPYAVRLLLEGTEAVGRQYEEQARVLGAGPIKAFWKVTFPVLKPVILSAFCMSYIVSFSQYFLTLLIGGGRIETFTIVMVPYLQSRERNIACIYSMIFLAVTVVVFCVFERIIGMWSKNQEAAFYE